MVMSAEMGLNLEFDQIPYNSPRLENFPINKYFAGKLSLITRSLSLSSIFSDSQSLRVSECPSPTDQAVWNIELWSCRSIYFDFIIQDLWII